jgi:hypothetical protein
MLILVLMGCTQSNVAIGDFGETAPGEQGPEDVAGLSGPQQVLFLGNSLTYSNGGVYTHCENLTKGDGTITIVEEHVVEGGATLADLYEDSRARERIASGAFDFVVLQEDIPETDVERFHEYARLFVADIEEAGAVPVFFMAWEYARLGWIDTEEIAAAHEEIAAELGAELAPVGLAWADAMESRPDLDLYDGDDEHPSISGTYLAANVIYATISGESPEGLSFVPQAIDEADALFLRQVAAARVLQGQ